MPGTIKVGGLTLSCNCVGAQIFAMDNELGEPAIINIMEGPSCWTEDLKAKNPLCQIPTLTDGDFGMGESNAILRYLAHVGKVTKAYPGAADPQLSAKIDMALDRFSGKGYKDFVETVYPIFGFTAPPADPAQAAAAAVAEIQKWCDVFLPVPGKFVAGSDAPTIADYRVLPFFLAYSLPCVQKKLGVVMPKRMCDWVSDFKGTTKNWEYLEKGGGFAIVEFLEGKCAA